MKFILMTLIFSLIIPGAFAAETTPANYKFKVFGRVRGESNENRDFNSTTDDKNNFVGSRFRASIDYSTKPGSSVFIEFQHTGQWGMPSGTASDGTSDVHQAYLSHSLNDSLRLYIGRQELLYGDQLIIGPIAWSNVGRSFDAFRSRWTHSLGWVDLFVADVSKTVGATTTNQHYFSGIYSNFNLDAIDDLDFYVLNSIDPIGTTEKKAIHFGTRLKSKHDAFDYRLEVTGQSEVTGHQADLELGYVVNQKSSTRVAFEVFVASKDYIQLFPTAHKWLGIGDFLSRRNLQGARLGLSNKFSDSFKAKLDYHMFQRNDDSLPAYTFSGATIGNTGRSADIGSEVDLTLSFLINQALAVEIVGTQFFVGDYLKENNLNDNGHAYFLQTSIKF